MWDLHGNQDARSKPYAAFIVKYPPIDYLTDALAGRKVR
jgi:hypothetical protein